MEFGYKIDANAWLQPDVSIEDEGQTENDYLEGAPALAVEVISESNWVFRQGHAEEFRGMLRSELFPGLAIDLDSLF